MTTLDTLVNWWFGQCPVWSSLLTPFLSMVWGIFHGEMWRAIGAGIWWLLCAAEKRLYD